MTDDDTPKLADVMDAPDQQPSDGRRWIVLYPEDYDNVGLDPEGNLAILVDQQQTGEILSLGAKVLAELSHRDAEGDDVIRDLIAGLEDVVDDD